MDTVPIQTPAELLLLPAQSVSADGPWLLWRTEPDVRLQDSLARYGQLQPILVDTSGDTPELIAGYRRLRCLQERDRDVLCVDCGRQDAWSRGLLYLQSNAGRELSDGELVRAVRYFHGLDPQRVAEIAPELGLEPRAKRLRLGLDWMRLPVVWDALLDSGHLPLACADILSTFDPASLEAVRILFEHLAWSRGNAVNVLSWLRDSALRERAAVAGIMATAGVREILAADLSPKDTMARITAAARRLRYPVLTGMEERFARAAQAVASGTKWKIVQPDQFESSAVELHVRVVSAAALRQVAQELSELSVRGECADLFAEER